MIKYVYFFSNGSIAVIDEQGNQVPQLQVSAIDLWRNLAERNGFRVEDCIVRTQLPGGAAPEWPMPKKPEYPQWICSDCGDRYGRKPCGIATWHQGQCGLCGTTGPVTEPRDYGHLK